MFGAKDTLALGWRLKGYWCWRIFIAPTWPLMWSRYNNHTYNSKCGRIWWMSSARRTRLGVFREFVLACWFNTIYRTYCTQFVHQHLWGIISCVWRAWWAPAPPIVANTGRDTFSEPTRLRFSIKLCNKLKAAWPAHTRPNPFAVCARCQQCQARPNIWTTTERSD